MTDYVLIYSGGSMPESPADQHKVLQAWTDWYNELGAAVKDGGNPFSPNAKAVNPDGSVSDVPSDKMMSGYSILQAPSLYAATAMAQKCPVLSSGGRVGVFETFSMV